jgi:hypothetical protein
MSGKTLAIYRLPTAKATRVGQVRVVRDRNRQLYIEGSKVITATAAPSDFLVLTLANEKKYYVKMQEYAQLEGLPSGA